MEIYKSSSRTSTGILRVGLLLPTAKYPCRSQNHIGEFFIVNISASKRPEFAAHALGSSPCEDDRDAMHMMTLVFCTGTIATNPRVRTAPVLGKKRLHPPSATAPAAEELKPKEIEEVCTIKSGLPACSRQNMT